MSFTRQLAGYVYLIYQGFIFKFQLTLLSLYDYSNHKIKFVITIVKSKTRKICFYLLIPFF